MSASPTMITPNGLSFPEGSRVMTERLRTLLSRGRYAGRAVGRCAAIVEPDAGIGHLPTMAICHHGAVAIACIEARPVLSDCIRQMHAANGATRSRVVNAVARPGPPSPERPTKLPSEKIAMPTASLDAVRADARRSGSGCCR